MFPVKALKFIKRHCNTLLNPQKYYVWLCETDIFEDKYCKIFVVCSTYNLLWQCRYAIELLETSALL